MVVQNMKNVTMSGISLGQGEPKQLWQFPSCMATNSFPIIELELLVRIRLALLVCVWGAIQDGNTKKTPREILSILYILRKTNDSTKYEQHDTK